MVPQKPTSDREKEQSLEAKLPQKSSLRLAPLLVIAFSTVLLLNLGSKIISDTYHIYKVQDFVSKGAEVRANSCLSHQERLAAMRSLQDMALGHNEKVVFRLPSNHRAIQELNVNDLRYQSTTQTLEKYQ